MDSEAASDLCRAHNEAMANAGRQARGRVNALGAVPLDHPGRAAEVLAEAVGLGLAGVEIPPTTGDRWLGDDVLEPFWAAAEELRAIIFVHPSARGLGLDVFDDYYLWNSVANPMETTIAAAQLVMAGVLERHPDLVVVLAHAGGAIGSITGRLDHAWHVRREAGMRLREPPSSSIGRFRFDTVSHDAELLRALVGRVGADHVLLGSDRPFDMGRTDPVADVKALQLTAEDEALILGENTQALVAAVRGPRLELSPTNEGMSRF
jgi:aminocarboxymuconate-semialdehyde decarboxylase